MLDIQLLLSILLYIDIHNMVGVKSLLIPRWEVANMNHIWFLQMFNDHATILWQNNIEHYKFLSLLSYDHILIYLLSSNLFRSFQWLENSR